jgi:hypothetical protein
MMRLAALCAVLVFTGCGLAQQGAFDVAAYRTPTTAVLVSSPMSDQTSGIQQMLDAKYAAGGGTVELPAGTFGTTGLTMNWPGKVTVNLRGAGSKATFLVKVGTSPAPILDLAAFTNAVEVHSCVSDLSLVGNARVSPGLTATGCAYLTVRNVCVSDCSIGIDFAGTLISSLADVCATNNNIGMRFREAGGLWPNLIAVDRGALRGNSQWGMDYGHGVGLTATGIDIESNGTAGDPATGGVITRATCATETGVGAIAFRSCWWELNLGTSLKMEQATGLCATIANCHILAAESGRAINAGKLRSITILDGISGSTSDTWTISAGQSFIMGGVVHALSDTSDLKTHLGITTGLSDVTNLTRTP